MKRIIALVLCVSLLFVFVCGCDAKNDAVSSDSSSENKHKVVYNDGMDYEQYNKKIADYWQTYEGTPPQHKKYTIYSTPLSGVKDGIVNDYNSQVLAVKNATKLYFGFILGCDIEQKPFTYVKIEKYTDDSLRYHQVVEFRDNKYELTSNFANNSKVVTNTYMLEGEEVKLMWQYDDYSVYTENSDAYLGSVTVRRDTGKVVQYEFYDRGEEPKDDITPIPKEEAREKIIQYVKDLCGEDILEDYKVESAEISKGNGYRLRTYYCVGEYKTVYSLHVWISDDGKLLEMQVDYGKEIFETVLEKYGIEAFDKAKAVLERAVEIPDPALFHIAFDSDGKLFLVVTTNRSYPNDGCWGSHPMHYAVEIIK